jgi:hypothetical protein
MNNHLYMLVVALSRMAVLFFFYDGAGGEDLNIDE